MSIENYGTYQLIKRLATGGMAQIYLARELEGPGDQLLVVKRILPHLSENVDFVRMFLDEARIAARLNHPNIVQIFNLGAQDDSYFIAMEYIHGEDVRRVWKRAHQVGRVVPLPLVCRIILEACAGLDFAHKKLDATGRPLDIVHRDVSPQNILVTFDGGVKVVDFGIAKAADQSTVTRSGVLKGKYSYMSPEQAAGKRLDHRSDIFALGVVLWELLTGARLFKRGNDIQTLNAVTACKVEPPSSVNPEVPPSLDAVVLRALAKSPDARYQEAAQLKEGLEAWLAEQKEPSGAAQLAAFMREIYADRLAAEAREGRVLVEALDASRGRSLKSRSASHSASVGASGKASRPERSEPAPSRPPRAERSERPSLPAREVSARERKTPSPPAEPPPAELTTPPESPTRFAEGSLFQQLTATEGLTARTASEQRRAKWVLFGLAAAVLVGVGAGLFWVWRSAPVPVVQPALQVGEAVPVLPSRVQLTLRSEPPGAALSVNGAPAGTTPVTLQVSPGEELSLRLELSGHFSLLHRLRVGEASEQEEVVTLEREAVEPSLEPVGSTRRPEPVRRGSERRREPQRFGTVRFAVTPWAEVICGSHRFGATPFPDQQLPVGVYDCKFTHPTHGTLTQRVEVRANEESRVTLKFDAP